MSSIVRDLNNKVFGKLTVLKIVSSTRSGNKTWLCECKCGNIKIMTSDHLTRKYKPVKSCGCNHYRTGKAHPNFTGLEEISSGWWYDHILKERKTRRTKIEINITIKYAWDLWKKQKETCSLSGIKLKIHNNPKTNTASIDRIDSSKGYVKGNIQWVHKHINMMKRIYSQEYFIDMCKKVAYYVK